METATSEYCDACRERFGTHEERVRRVDGVFHPLCWEWANDKGWWETITCPDCEQSVYVWFVRLNRYCPLCQKTQVVRLLP